MISVVRFVVRVFIDADGAAGASLTIPTSTGPLGAEPGATASIVATLDCWSYNAAAKARRFAMLLFAAEIRTENRPRACESN